MIDFKLFTTTLVITFFAVFLEMIFIGWKDCSLRRLLKPSRSAMGDLIYFALSLLQKNEVLILIFSLGLSHWLQNFIPNYVTWTLTGLSSSEWIQLGVNILALDFINYWSHRLSHKISFLWQFHRYHHAATELNIITAERLHIMERVFHILLMSFPIALVGSPPEALIGFFGITFLLSLLRHSKLNWSWGWFGQYVLISPQGHQIHHSICEEHFGKNFGSISPLWDRLFGTWQKEADFPLEIGLEDNEFENLSFLKGQFIAFKKAFRS